MNGLHGPAGRNGGPSKDSHRPRVLFLTKYSRAGASSRYRTYQYLPYLEDAGFHCEVAPLFDQRYLAKKYEQRRTPLLDAARAFFRRILDLARVRRFDLVVIEYELLPYWPAVFERWLRWAGIPYVVDYDDALFHQYDRHRSWLVRTFLGGKIATVMRGARLVVAGNEYLARYARESGASWVEVLPTVIDVRNYQTQPSTERSAALTIGWIGSPATAKYLESIIPALGRLSREGNVRVRLIGSGSVLLPGVDVDVVPWSEASEAADISSFDVGVMPLPDEPWERGKCGFKLIQYMACSVPVVASPVGANRQIVEDGVNGFLASTEDEWVCALTRIAQDPAGSLRMGGEGRRLVEEKYSVQVTAPLLAGLLARASQESNAR
jgi:glycosyltransferase involved in cell wall biosynthesis